MKNKSLKHGITVILIANIVNMIFNLATNFLLPKYLTINTYSQIKTFILYTSYIGILHLGYSDGMYLRYGGKDILSIPTRELATDIKTMRITQIVITVILSFISIFVGDPVLIASAVAIAPINMGNYYKYLLQATGEFDNYSKVLNFTTIFTSVLLLLLVILGNYSNSIGYLLVYLVVDIVIWIYLEWLLKCKYSIHSISEGKWCLNVLVNNIRDGFLLMLGTFSNIILTGLDRWFVKLYMNNVAFAMYSFAVSIEGLMNVVVTPISITFYNYFCGLTDKRNIGVIKDKIVIFSVYVVSCAYGAKFIIEIFLPKYIDSINVIFILFASQIFFIITKCLYANLYKSEKKQKIYFVKLILVIIFGIIYNEIFYILLHTKEAFAIGTYLCGITWLILSEMDFRYCKTSLMEKIYLIGVSCLFMVLGAFVEGIIGFVVYILAITILTYIIYKNVFVDCIRDIGFLILKETKKIIRHC